MSTVGTYVNTRVQTAVHLTDAILGTFQNIVAHLGLNPLYLTGNWATIELGLKTWITDGSLKDIQLECGDVSAPHTVFSIPVDYSLSGDGDVEFVTSQARLTRALAKLTAVPNGTAYRVVVSHHGTPRAVAGWSSTTAADTSGMTSYSFGSLASGPDARASMTYHGRG